MNELKHILEKYLSGEEKSISFHKDDTQSKKSLFKLSKFFNNLTSYDSPDIYSIHKNRVLIIEHFQFDSSTSIKYGGSLQKHEEARVENNFKKIVAKNRNSETVLHDTVNSEPCFENYKENFTRNYIKHYNKINQYVSNLRDVKIIKKYTKYKISFFIEDSSALGNYYLDENKRPNYIILLYTKFFWDFIKDYKENIDYIFWIV